MSPYALADAASAINLDHPGTYVSWSFIDISLANLIVIAVMVVIFGAALLVPFGSRHDAQLADPGTGTMAGTADADGPAGPGPAADDPDAGMWTSRVRRLRAAAAAARQAPARPAARLRRLVDLHLRRGDAGDPRPGDHLRLRARARRPGLVPLQPGRPLLQQRAPVERRAVHGVHGHPPVGQVLDGGLARPPGHDLDHRRGRVRRLGSGMLHRLPVPVELRLPVDRDQRQGRLQRHRHRRVLQRPELRPDAHVAHRPHPDRPRRDRRRARADGPGPRRRPPAARPHHDPAQPRRPQDRRRRRRGALARPHPPLRHPQGRHRRRRHRRRPGAPHGRAAVLPRPAAAQRPDLGESQRRRLRRHRRRRTGRHRPRRILRTALQQRDQRAAASRARSTGRSSPG